MLDRLATLASTLLVSACSVVGVRSGTEEPRFDLLGVEAGLEIRRYVPRLAAETMVAGTEAAARNEGFSRLARYIFGGNRGASRIAMTAPVAQEPARIAMTAPVIQQETGEGAWRMRFVMPSQYTLATLPPAPSDITLTEVPARRMAAVRFSGNGGAADLAAREASLRRWMEGQGIIATGEAEFAFYDAPMVPGPLRRNEVLIPVAAQ